jgi:hypothetical protein
MQGKHPNLPKRGWYVPIDKAEKGDVSVLAQTANRQKVHLYQYSDISF